MAIKGTVKWFDVKKALVLFNRKTVTMYLFTIQIFREMVSKF